jgi:hypothetical protein
MSNFPRKANPSSGRFELPEVITPSRVEFLGEQTDPADEHKKTRLRWVFEQTPRIFQRAYLARVFYGEPGVSSVVLCVRHIDDIEQTLQKGFAHMFREISRRGDFYDWMILDEEKERELKKVCKPFYEAAQSGRREDCPPGSHTT